MNRKSELIKCISTDLCRFAVIARRKIEVIAMTMTRFDDNARTAKIHEDGLMALVSSHLAPMSIKGLLRVQLPVPSPNSSYYLPLASRSASRVYRLLVRSLATAVFKADLEPRSITCFFALVTAV